MKKVLLYFSLLFLIQFVNSIIVSWTYGNYIVPVLFFFALLLPGLLFREISMDWFNRELFAKGGLKSLLISFVATSLVLLVFHFSWFLISQSFSSVPKLAIDSKLFGQFSIFILLNLLTICMVEELIFRGFIQGEMNKVPDSPLMKIIFFQILFPSFLFGLIHVFRLHHMCWIIIFPGIYFAILKFTTKHISGPILAHLLFNLYYLVLNDPKPF